MKQFKWVLLSGAALLALTACDFIRYPGDGGPPPKTPDAGPAIPPDAPGPPPPTTPVEDPYGNGDTVDSGNVPGTGDADDAPAAGDSGTADTGDAPDAGPVDTPDQPPADPVSDTDTPDGDTPDTDQPDPVEPPPAAEPVFSYFEAGALIPGTGTGAPDQIVYAPDMVFPIESDPAYLQSQVFNFGGGVAGGDQCDPRNYAYPWRDNFCEVRSANRGSPYCPLDKIHQGQDIRVGSAASCNTLRSTPAEERTLHKVVAVEDGVISHVGTYSVNLRAGGRIYKYMHLNMSKLQVQAGQTVKAGDHIGYISNDFGGTPTTFHLHFEITQNAGNGQWVHVPPYLSLVAAYERRENGPGEKIHAGDVGVASTQGFVVTPDMEIIE